MLTILEHNWKFYEYFKEENILKKKKLARL